MSRTREIGRADWNKFLNGLAEGKPKVQVRLEDVELGDLPFIEHKALTRFEVDSSRPQVAIELSLDEQLSHRIERPQHVYVEEDDAGFIEFVDIEDEDQHKTLVRIETSASPF